MILGSCMYHRDQQMVYCCCLWRRSVQLLQQQPGQCHQPWSAWVVPDDMAPYIELDELVFLQWALLCDMTIHTTHHFKRHLPGKPGLAGCLLDSQSPVILILSILTRCDQRLHSCSEQLSEAMGREWLRWSLLYCDVFLHFGYLVLVFHTKRFQTYYVSGE